MPVQDFIKAVAEETCRRLHEFSAQHISNVVWSLAKFDYSHIALLQAAVGHALTDISRYQSQSVSNMTWAFATLGFQPGGTSFCF